MSSVLVDTNVLIDYLRGVSGAVSYLEASRGDMSVSAVTVAELHAGARSDREREMLREFVASFDIVVADELICEMGGQFRADYGPSHSIDVINGIIAATAVLRQLPLVTVNARHFPMLQNVVVPYKRG